MRENGGSVAAAPAICKKDRRASFIAEIFSVTLRCAAKPRLEGRRPPKSAAADLGIEYIEIGEPISIGLGRHPSRLASLAPQDDGTMSSHHASRYSALALSRK